MRLSPEPPAAGAKRELTDADRARIDARMARFGVAQEFAQAGLVVGEDYRKVAQLYEQLSAQAGSRGEALPAMDVWLQQRAQERLAQGYLPTLPEGGAVQPFEAAMNEAAGLAAGGRGAAATDLPGRSMSAAAGLPADPARGPAAVEGLLGQLGLGQQLREVEVKAAGSPGATASINADTLSRLSSESANAPAADDAERTTSAEPLGKPATAVEALAVAVAGDTKHRGDADSVLDQIANARARGRNG